MWGTQNPSNFPLNVFNVPFRLIGIHLDHCKNKIQIFNFCLFRRLCRRSEVTVGSENFSIYFLKSIFVQEGSSGTRFDYGQFEIRPALLFSGHKKGPFTSYRRAISTNTRNQFDMYSFVSQSWCAFWQKNDMLLKWSIVKQTSEPKPQRRHIISRTHRFYVVFKSSLYVILWYAFINRLAV